MSEPFKAFIVDKTEDTFSADIKPISFDDLPKADVLIKVAYSSINYKDGLASIPLDTICNEITLDNLPETLPLILNGQAKGRYLVKI